jgi:hypothetical protein
VSKRLRTIIDFRRIEGAIWQMKLEQQHLPRRAEQRLAAKGDRIEATAEGGDRVREADREVHAKAGENIFGAKRFASSASKKLTR